jgi:L-iditol 2-dehydrogenase
MRPGSSCRLGQLESRGSEKFMQVASLPRANAFAIAMKPIPQVLGNYVLIKVYVAPMCNEYIAYRWWDFRDRNRPDSLGHEAAGEVVEADAASQFKPGDRVVALSGYPCGQCFLCHSGQYAHCMNTVDPLTLCNSDSGECGFAQYMIKPDWLLLRIPDDMSYEHASMACCGLGATFTAMENMGIGSGDTVLVTGLGPVGLGGVINGVAKGARVIAVGSTPYRLRLAKELGASATVEPCTTDTCQTIARLTGSIGVDYAIDCSAQAPYQRLALDAVRRGGSVTFLGESGELKLHVDRDLIQKGVTLRGSLDLYLPHADKVLATIAKTGDLIDRLITHEFLLEEIEEAWKLQLERSCGKIIIRPWS